MGVFLSPSTYDVSGLKKTREQMRRHVRLMFVYPLVYMLLWVAPLVAHVFKWHNPTQTVPFAASLLSLASLAAQGAVNCWLFSTREQPWEHKAGEKHGSHGTHSNSAGGQTTRFGEWGRSKNLERSYSSGPGRTRQEMLADGKIAHKRRLKEESEERNIGTGGEKPREQPPVKKEWWDAEEERVIRGFGLSHGASAR
jgi:G protein-coupled receptor GPR1